MTTDIHLINRFITYRHPRKTSEVFLCNAQEAYAMERYRVPLYQRFVQSPVLMVCVAIVGICLLGAI